MAYPLTREIFRQFSKQDEFLRLKSSALFLVAVGIPDRGNVVGNGGCGQLGGERGWRWWRRASWLVMRRAMVVIGLECLKSVRPELGDKSLVYKKIIIKN